MSEMYIAKITPYLIQRCQFEYVDKKRNEVGIDNILAFCYMGATEYEWDALPNSLKEIHSKINKYVYFDMKINDKNITVFCLSDFKEVIEEVIIGLSKGSFHLKERCYFDDFVSGKYNYSYHKSDCWWDIRNHFLFWRKDEEFERLFKELIKPIK